MSAVAAVVGVVLAFTGCARNPALVAWDREFQALDGEEGEPARRDAGYEALERTAPRPAEWAAARFARVRALRTRGRATPAARLLIDAARRAPRRADRARAHYELARLAEDRGRLVDAVRIYRRIVRTYPELMPGERSLAHLARILGARGLAGLRAHLRWTRRAYDALQDSALADNLIDYPARLAQARFVETGQARWASLAEALYTRIIDEHRASGLWNDAVWQRSLLYHRQGRWRDELRDIRRVQRSYEKLSLFGHDDHPYFWQGQIRVARVELLRLHDARAAAQSLAAFVPRYPDSRWRDDVLFWEGCAWLRVAERERAERAFAAVREVNADSKYLRHLGDAHRDPSGPYCVPRDFARGRW